MDKLSANSFALIYRAPPVENLYASCNDTGYLNQASKFKFMHDNVDQKYENSKNSPTTITLTSPKLQSSKAKKLSEFCKKSKKMNKLVANLSEIDHLEIDYDKLATALMKNLENSKITNCQPMHDLFLGEFNDILPDSKCLMWFKTCLQQANSEESENYTKNLKYLLSCAPKNCDQVPNFQNFESKKIRNLIVKFSPAWFEKMKISELEIRKMVTDYLTFWEKQYSSGRI